MSSFTSRGEGDAVLSVYSLLHSSQRRKPFLNRNVRKTLETLTMGTTLSSFSSSRGSKRRDISIESENDTEEEPRPAKRRRLNPFESNDNTTSDQSGSGSRQPLNQVMSNARSSKPGLLEPFDFYGKTKSTSRISSSLKTPTPTPAMEVEGPSKFSIDDLLPTSASNFTRSLRLDVVNIIPMDGNGSEVLNLSTIDQPSINIHCSVVVALYYRNPGEDQENQTNIERTRESKECMLRITPDRNGGYSREFIGLDPFYFLPRDIYVQQKVRKPNGQWAGSEYIIADKYLLTVTVEPCYFHPDWPALDIPESDAVSKRIAKGECGFSDFHLMSSISLFSHPGTQRQSTLALCANHHPGKKLQILPYTLNLQVQWAVPNVLTKVILPTLKSELSPRVKAPVSEPAPVQEVPASPSSRKADQASVENSPANSRAQRPRKDVQTYNLKTLSTIAQGKSPRKRKPREPRTEESLDGLTVTYALGKAEAADAGVKQQTTVPGLTCPFCNTINRTVDELRLHLHTNHGAFKFHLRRERPRVQFFVELVKSRSGPTLDTGRSKIFQLGKPKDLFDLDKYLHGEDWTKSRHGPQHGLWPDHLMTRANESSLSSSSHGSRYSSPNTSNTTDDAVDFDTDDGKLPIRSRKKFYVPKTAKPLYDSVTKRILQPGEEIPNSEDEVDEDWLHMMHRDLVNDFTDVTPEEKDYINEWNPFIVAQRLTGDKYLPDAILRFIEAKKGWFTENKSRKKEFVKHMETFILRGVVDEKCLIKCVDILRQDEQKAKSKTQQPEENVVMKDVEAEKPVSKPRPPFFCICGAFTQPPNRVICKGPTCPGRYFCKPCAKAPGRLTAGPWKCDECFSSSG